MSARNDRALNGTPFRFLDPEAEWLAWQSRVHAFELDCDLRLEELRTEAAQPGLHASTSKRLHRWIEAREQQRLVIRELLNPFYPLPQGYPVDLHLRSRVPPRQGLLNYSTNIQRDWAPWGLQENLENLGLARDLLAGANPDRTLIVGAGAGRLSYDFHQVTLGSTLALDLNPLLVEIAKRMVSGGILRWPDFPPHPSSDEATCPIEELPGASPPRPGLEFQIGDILNPPSDLGSFDLILTPWVIDILPVPFETLGLRLNSLLNPGGLWLNFGSLAYPARPPVWNPVPTEIRESLEETGFRVERMFRKKMPYLSSPHVAQSRTEDVFAFRAVKQEHRSPPPGHHPLPDWILDTHLPVPRLPEVQALQQKSGIFIDVCERIDGKTPIELLGRYLEKKHGLPEAAAREALKKFLLDLLNQN